MKLIQFVLGLCLGAVISVYLRAGAPQDETLAAYSEKRPLLKTAATVGGRRNDPNQFILGCNNTAKLPRRVWTHPLEFWEQQRKENSDNPICPTLSFNLNHVEDSYVILGDTDSAYYHLHKVGGTTMEKVHFTQNEDYLLARMRLKHHKALTKNLIETIIAKKDAVLFTFMRDPVSRFLSSLGQMLSMHQRVKLKPCINIANNTDELMHCVLDKIEAKGIFDPASGNGYRRGNRPVTYDFLDQHLTPQSIELLSSVQNTDLSPMVMPMDEMSVFLEACTEGPPKKMRSVSHNTTVGKFYVDESVLTPELVARICSVYHWDVEFLQQQLHGMVPTVCDDIP